MIGIADDNRVALMTLVMDGETPKCRICEEILDFNNATVVHDFENDVDILYCPMHASAFRLFYDPWVARLTEVVKKNAVESKLNHCMICGDSNELVFTNLGDKIVQMCEYHFREFNISGVLE